MEEAEASDVEAEAIRRLVAAALAALSGGPEVVEGRSRGFAFGHEVLVEVITEVGGDRGELRLTFEGPDPAAAAVHSMNAINGVPPPLWNPEPTAPSAQFYVTLTLSQLTGGLDPKEIGGPDQPVHITHARFLAESLVTGHVVAALCGAVFLPTETGDATRDRAVCTRCTVVWAILNRVLQSGETLP